jgi:hypothetical protein
MSLPDEEILTYPLLTYVKKWRNKKTDLGTLTFLSGRETIPKGFSLYVRILKQNFVNF